MDTLHDKSERVRESEQSIVKLGETGMQSEVLYHVQRGKD